MPSKKFENRVSVTFTPENEPYLGRRTLLAFDKLIVSCLAVNTIIAPQTHHLKKMICNGRLASLFQQAFP